MERVDRVIKVGLAVAAVLYLGLGITLAIVHPRLSPSEQLVTTYTRRPCGSDDIAALVALWPIYANYYYFGAFDTCRRTLRAG
jgi:hypothetical protein